MAPTPPALGTKPATARTKPIPKASPWRGEEAEEWGAGLGKQVKGRVPRVRPLLGTQERRGWWMEGLLRPE